VRTADQEWPPLRVAAAARRLFGDSSATARDSRLPAFFADLAAPYRLAYDDRAWQAGRGQSYAEMCQPLVEALVTDDRPIDLVVLAYDLHDLRPGQATSVLLSHLCPGEPLALTVCDQGTAAVFTALRLIQTYARAGQARRALLLTAEQAAVPYQLPEPVSLPSRQAAVGLLLSDEPGWQLGPVRQQPGVAADRAGALLAEELAGAGSADQTVLLGSGLPAGTPSCLPAAEVIEPVSGQPATAAWWELVAKLTEHRDSGRQLVVADYEPRLRYLSTVTAVHTREAQRPREAQPDGVLAGG